jgi:hypothetical protein
VQMVAAWIAPRSVRASRRLRRTRSLSRAVVPTTVATRPIAELERIGMLPRSGHSRPAVI